MVGGSGRRSDGGKVRIGAALLFLFHTKREMGVATGVH